MCAERPAEHHAHGRSIQVVNEFEVYKLDDLVITVVRKVRIQQKPVLVMPSSTDKMLDILHEFC